MRDLFIFIKLASQLMHIGEVWGKWELLHLALGSTDWYHCFGDEFGYMTKWKVCT